MTAPKIEPTVTILRTVEGDARGQWRAIVEVPLNLVGFPYVQGGSGTPPWVEGFAMSPHGALNEAYQTAGRALIMGSPKAPT